MREPLSKKIVEIKPSGIRKFFDMVSEMPDAISLGVGEPDFDTPEIIKDEAIRALKSGFTKYTAVAGIPELLEAIKDKLLRENTLAYERNEILVSNGAKHSLFNVFQALVDKDDEVIIPSPYWVTYPELVTFSGGKSVIVQTTQANNFKITPKKLNFHFPQISLPRSGGLRPD